MNSRTSAAESSSPFRLRSISSTACIGASLFLGIDHEALRKRNLPLLGAQPALGLVEQPLDLPVLARDTRSRDARALPGVVVVDLRDGRADAVLELRLRGAKMMALLLQRVRLREVELAGENSDPAARHGPDSSGLDGALDDRGSRAHRGDLCVARTPQQLLEQVEPPRSAALEDAPSFRRGLDPDRPCVIHVRIPTHEPL